MAQSNGSSLVWFLAGVAVGAAVALLCAPQSGRDTRQYIGKKSAAGRDYLTEHGREVYQKGRELYDRGKDLAEDAADLFERGRKVVGMT